MLARHEGQPATCLKARVDLCITRITTWLWAYRTSAGATINEHAKTGQKFGRDEWNATIGLIDLLELASSKEYSLQCQPVLFKLLQGLGIIKYSLTSYLGHEWLSGVQIVVFWEQERRDEREIWRNPCLEGWGARMFVEGLWHCVRQCRGLVQSPMQYPRRSYKQK